MPQPQQFPFLQTLFFSLFLMMMTASPEPAIAQHQNPAGPLERIQAFSQHYQDLPREQVFIQTDRERYFWGDRIWFSAFVTGGSNRLFSGISRLLYVELYDDAGTLIDRTFVRLDNGSGHGSLTFGESEERTGVFTIQAYTSWMLNFEETYLFRKAIEVVQPGQLTETMPADLSQATLTFFPEGGTLLAGVHSQVVVKATLPDGRAIAVQGEISSASGTETIAFSTDDTGLGAFRFTPEAGQAYEAVIFETSARFELPVVLTQGARLAVQQDEGNGQFVLNLRTLGLNTEIVTVFGHVRGSVYYLTEMELFNGTGLGWASADLFPPGVVEFVALDADGNPVSRRSILNLRDDASLNLSLDVSQETFRTREQVMLRLQIRDAEGRPVQGLASVSVTEQQPVQTGSLPAPTIAAQQLAGHLLGFDQPSHMMPVLLDSGRLTEADHLLQTAPPQDFVWEVLQNPDAVGSITLPENGFSVSGTIRTGFRGRPVEEANVVFAMGANDDDLFVIDTSPDGRFLMNDIDIMGSAQVNIRATDRRGRSNVRIGLDEQFSFLPEFRVTAPQTLRVLQGEAADTEPGLAERIRQARLNEEQHIMAAMQIELEEVTVTAEREDVDEALRRLATGDVGGSVLRVADSPELQSLTIYDLLMRLPGVRVAGTSVRVRTGAIQDAPPIILLDGATIEEELLASIPASDVDNVSVLRRPDQLARFGAQGATGVISIRTIRGEGIPGRGLPRVSAFLKGFDEPPPFFSPRYGGILPQLTDEVPDTRVTLHWQPNFVIQPNGREILFFTGDVPGTYCATAQGLTADGRTFSGQTCFTVEE